MVDAKTNNKSLIKRIFYSEILHTLLPPCGVGVRWAGAWTLFVLGMSRLGIIPSGFTPTVVPYNIYAILMLVGWAILLLTLNKRFTWYGRLAAAYGFALLGGFAIDILPAYTSALLMAIPALALLGEVGVINEC